MSKRLNSILILTCKSPHIDNARVHIPMGILYLDAAIKRDLPNLTVEIDDDYDLTEKGLERFKEFDAIGVSVMTPQRKEASSIVHKIKSLWPEKILIAGGPHISHYIDDVKDEPWDYLVRGDGERDIIKILKGEARERILNDILLRKELSSIPKPNRIGRKKFLGKYEYELKPGVKSTALITSRGCPLGCAFCENARTTTRWHDVELVDEELKDIKALGYGAFFIPDDLFAISLKKIEPYLEVIKKSGLIFRCNGHARFMTDEFARALKDAGCYEISFGAESGSQKILDNINKDTQVRQNYEFIKIVKRYGIRAKAYIMLGLPGEDSKTIAETEEFIENAKNKYKMDDFQLSIFYPYKGTAIRKAMDGGEDIDLKFLGEGLGAHTHGKGLSESRVQTKVLSPEDLLKARTRIIEKYKPKSHISGWKKICKS